MAAIEIEQCLEHDILYCHSGLEQEERWGCGNRLSCRETKELSLEVLA